MLPLWLTVELALIPVIGGILAFVVRFQMRLSELVTWRQTQEKAFEKLQEDHEKTLDLLLEVKGSLDRILGKMEAEKEWRQK